MLRLTHFKEFNLESVRRHRAFRKEFDRKTQEAQKKTLFKAQPILRQAYYPFQTRPSTKHLSVPVAPSFMTRIRGSTILEE